MKNQPSFEEIILGLKEDLTRLTAMQERQHTGMRPDEEREITSHSEEDNPMMVAQEELTCGEVDYLMQDWYEQPEHYDFAFDRYPHFREIGYHMREHGGCERCRQLHTGLDPATTRKNYEQARQLVMASLKTLQNTKVKAVPLSLWQEMLKQVNRHHPSYPLPEIQFADGVSLRARIRWPEEIYPSSGLTAKELPVNQSASITLRVNAPAETRLEDLQVNLLLWDELGNELWNGQSKTFTQDIDRGEWFSQLHEVPLQALHQTALLDWAASYLAIHEPNIPPTIPAPVSLISAEDLLTLVPVIIWRATDVEEPLQTARNKFLFSLENQQEIQRIRESLTAEDLAQLSGRDLNDWGTHILKQLDKEHDVEIWLKANANPEESDCYDLLVLLVEPDGTGSIDRRLNKQRWILRLEPEGQEKIVSKGHVSFKKLRMRFDESGGSEWKLYLRPAEETDSQPNR